MRGLSKQFAPQTFVVDLERRVRTRSRGRFFAQDILYSTRVPYEVFAAVMLAIMAALFLVSLPPDPTVVEPLAMGGEKAPSQDSGSAEASEAPDGATEAFAPVVPLKREVIEYTLTILTADPTGKAAELAQRIRATSDTYKVGETPDGLVVRLPPSAVDSFLEVWSTEGELHKKRVWQREDEPNAVIRIRMGKTRK